MDEVLKEEFLSAIEKVQDKVLKDALNVSGVSMSRYARWLAEDKKFIGRVTKVVAARLAKADNKD